jgi:hypothetical protein
LQARRTAERKSGAPGLITCRMSICVDMH